MSACNFDTVIDRRQTSSSKWDKYQGQDILPMWVADMDFSVAEPILAALADRLRHPIFGYTLPPDSLLQVIVDRFRSRYGWKVEIEDLELVPGVVPALNQAIRGLVRPGGGVATAVPVYHPFLEAPENMGRTLHRLPMNEADGWQFPVKAFEALAMMNPEVDVLLLCHPMNPVGKVIAPNVLAEIVRICTQHDIVICSDEIHCELLLDGRTHTPTASLGPAAASQTLTFQAASKSFNLAGLGCAVVIGQNPELLARFKAGGEGIMANVNTLGYVATEAAWSLCDEWHRDLLDYLAGNRDLLLERIRGIEGLSMGPIEATYLGWINVKDLMLENPLQFFEDAGVGLSPGAQFEGSGYMRLNFGCPRSELALALDRIERACAAR